MAKAQELRERDELIKYKLKDYFNDKKLRTSTLNDK